MSANTAIHIVPIPNKTRIRNTAFNPRLMATFTQIVRIVARPRLRAKGRRCKLSSIKAMSAVSKACAVPAAPMATPACEAANAGASLIPSPTNITGNFLA